MCLLHSYAHPRHEREVARRLRRALPGVHVVASVDVAPEFREYERASTAVADAYLGPVAGRYLRRLGRSAAERGLPEPDVMQSSGGVCALAEAAAHPVRLLLSGPAGGVAAVVGPRRPRGGQLRHGRHVDRRLPHPRRRGRALVAADRRRPARARAARRHPHRRRGRRHHRLARRGRRAAGRAAERGGRSRAGCLRPRRPPADGDRRERRPRTARPDGADRRRAAPRRGGRADGAARGRRRRSGRCARPPRA